MNPTKKFRYPFRSAEVTGILSNLTEGELGRIRPFFDLTPRVKCKSLRNWVIATGLLSISLSVLAIWTVIDYFFHADWSHLLVMCTCLILSTAFQLCTGRSVTAALFMKMYKGVLCDTAYAREMGYTPETLRMFSFSPRTASPEQSVH